MLFKEALDALIEGKYVGRSSWTDGKYLVFLPGNTSVFQISFNSPTGGINVVNYLWLVTDFQSEDWEVYNKRDDVPPPHAAPVAVAPQA